MKTSKKHQPAQSPLAANPQTETNFYPLLTSPDDLMNINEAADFLNVTVRSIHRYVKNGELPSATLGGNRFFSKSFTLAYLRRQMINSVRRRIKEKSQ